MSGKCLSLLFLIGYRGAGKTTIARLLAALLGWDWLDADQALEERDGRTILEIFEEEGEAGFRDKEASLLREICTRQRLVVATGGGVILREENRRLLRRGFVMWLRADAATLWARIQQDDANAKRRPNLGRGGIEEVEELLQQREPLYSDCAEVVVNVVERSPDEIAHMIFAQLGKWGLATRQDC